MGQEETDHISSNNSTLSILHLVRDAPQIYQHLLQWPQS